MVVIPIIYAHIKPYQKKMNKIKTISKVIMLFLIIEMAITILIGTVSTISNLQGKPSLSLIVAQNNNFLSGVSYDETIKIKDKVFDPNSDLQNLNSRLLKVGSNITSMTANLALYYFLFMLFRNYSQGKIFQIENSKLLMICAIIYLLDSVLINQICTNLDLLSATINLPEGERVLSLTFGNHQIHSLTKGVLLLVISWIMKEAQQIKEEQDLVV